MKRNKAFTLIELVMVIVILGIMAAVALPTFFNLQGQAKEAAVKGALGGLRSGVAVWYAKSAASGAATYPTIGELTQTSGSGVMGGGMFPTNPYTSATGVVAGTTETANTAVAWVYDVLTGKIWSAAAITQGSGF